MARYGSKLKKKSKGLDGWGCLGRSNAHLGHGWAPLRMDSAEQEEGFQIEAFLSEGLSQLR